MEETGSDHSNLHGDQGVGRRPYHLSGLFHAFSMAPVLPEREAEVGKRDEEELLRISPCGHGGGQGNRPVCPGRPPWLGIWSSVGETLNNRPELNFREPVKQ